MLVALFSRGEHGWRRGSRTPVSATARATAPSPSVSFTEPESNGPWRRSALAVRRFLRDEAGPTAVEYAVILMAIVSVCVGAITVIGNVTNSHFEDTVNGFPE